MFFYRFGSSRPFSVLNVKNTDHHRPDRYTLPGTTNPRIVHVCSIITSSTQPQICTPREQHGNSNRWRSSTVIISDSHNFSRQGKPGDLLIKARRAKRAKNVPTEGPPLEASFYAGDTQKVWPKVEDSRKFLNTKKLLQFTQGKNKNDNYKKCGSLPRTAVDDRERNW